MGYIIGILFSLFIFVILIKLCAIAISSITTSIRPLLSSKQPPLSFRNHTFLEPNSHTHHQLHNNPELTQMLQAAYRQGFNDAMQQNRSHTHQINH